MYKHTREFLQELSAVSDPTAVSSASDSAPVTSSTEEQPLDLDSSSVNSEDYATAHTTSTSTSTASISTSVSATTPATPSDFTTSLSQDMSAVDIITARNPIDFEFDVISYSASYQEKLLANTLNDFLKLPNANAKDATIHAPDLVEDKEEITIPGLPALHRGHPQVHLRQGVIAASQLAAEGEPDAEKAFFVGDLSYVYQQHLRWKKNLPEIDPFYGE